MNQLLCLLLPAVFATHTYEKMSNKELNIKQWVKKYLIFTLFINMFCYAIVIYIFNKEHFIFTNLFTLKYAILGTILSIVLSILSCFIEKSFEIDVRTEKNEK